MADDPDPVTRRELQELLVRGDEEALLERFAAPIDFGTAGIRGLLGAGPARMNVVTVSRATAGLALHLVETMPEAYERGIVVARDARRGSPELATVVAEVLAGHALPVHWFPDPVPTPVGAFAGRHLGAAATVIVTASHNPPQYNGMKVYSDQAYQIVPPWDEAIREHWREAAPTPQIPRMPMVEAREQGLISDVPDSVGEAYLAALDAQCYGEQPPPADVVAVTTALHGVGHAWVERALHRRGFRSLHPVPEQAQPDGAFPTTPFPNPEEPGALDRSTLR